MFPKIEATGNNYEIELLKQTLKANFVIKQREIAYKLDLSEKIERAIVTIKLDLLPYKKPQESTNETE